MDNQFPEGSFVWLKSGGPKMTVGYAQTNGSKCHWFDGGTLGECFFIWPELTDKDPALERFRLKETGAIPFDELHTLSHERQAEIWAAHDAGQLKPETVNGVQCLVPLGYVAENPSTLPG